MIHDFKSRKSETSHYLLAIAGSRFVLLMASNVTSQEIVHINCLVVICVMNMDFSSFEIG
jgi:hypothetical protein